MKSKILFQAVLAVLFLIFFTLPVYALGLGSPAGTLDVGETSISGSLTYTSFEAGDNDVNAKSFIFKGAHGSTSSITPYFKLGFADLEVEDVSFRGSLDFAFGGGVTLGLLQPQDESGLEVAVDAQILWWDSSDGSAKLVVHVDRKWSAI